MKEFAELAPEPPENTYAEIHRDPVTGDLTFIEASPQDNVLYASEMGNHSMLDELRVMYHGQLPPEYLYADGLSTETVAGKGSVEQTPDGPVLHINHFRNRGDKTEKELLDEVRATVSDKGITKVLFEERQMYPPEVGEVGDEEGDIPIRADVRQLPDAEVPEAVFSSEVDSGVVIALHYEQDESGQKTGVLQTIQAHSKLHQPVLEAAGFDGRGMAPRNSPVLFTRSGEPVMGGIRYVVDDKNGLFSVSLISPRAVSEERKLEVLRTAARTLYDELGLDAHYRQEFTIGDSRSNVPVDPAIIMEPNSTKAVLYDATLRTD